MNDVLTALGGAPREGLTKRQDELFGQILDLFLGEGFGDFTLDQVAARLRCSKSTIYALAPSRDELALSVVTHFFSRATDRIEARVAAAADPAARLEAYLTGVAEELAPASAHFMEDLSANRATQRLYEFNTRAAAQRVRDLLTEGVEAGAFRPVSTQFVAEVVSTAMVAIQTRRIATATGLSDSAAYGELAALVLSGARRD